MPLFIDILKAVENSDEARSNSIIHLVLGKLQELLECPISMEKIRTPLILPSGNTVDEESFNKLVNKNDPFNKNFKVKEKTINRFAKQVIEIIDSVSDQIGDLKIGTTIKNLDNLLCRVHHDISKMLFSNIFDNSFL